MFYLNLKLSGRVRSYIDGRREKLFAEKAPFLFRLFAPVIVLCVMAVSQGAGQTRINLASAPDRTEKVKEAAPPTASIKDKVRDNAATPDDEDEDELIQELFLAETVSVQKANELQITFGNDYFRKNRSHLWQSALVLEYGITNSLQIGAEVPLIGSKEYEDAGEVEISLAYALAKNLRSMAITAGVSMVFAERDAEVETSSKRMYAEPFIVVARKIGRGELHADFSKTITSDGEFSFNLAGVYPWRNWRCALELNGVAGNGSEVILTPGIIRRIDDSKEFGIGFPVGLTKDTNSIGIVFKATFEFNLWPFRRNRDK